MQGVGGFLSGIGTLCSQAFSTLAGQNGVSVSDWRIACELKADIHDLAKVTKPSDNNLATRITALAEKVQPGTDLKKVVSDLSLLFRVNNLTNDQALKRNALSFFVKFSAFVTDPNENLTLSANPVRVIPKLVMQYQSDTVNEMLSDDVADTLPLEGLDEDVSASSKEAFYNCLKSCTSEKYLTRSNVEGVLLLAHKFNIAWLEGVCVDYIGGMLHAKNVLSLLEKGSIFNISSLCNLCLCFLLENPIPARLSKQVEKIADRFDYGILKWKLDPDLQKALKSLKIQVVHSDNKKCLQLQMNTDILTVAKEHLETVLTCGKRTNPIPLYLEATNYTGSANNARFVPFLTQLIQKHSIVSFTPIQITFETKLMKLLVKAIKQNSNFKELHLSHADIFPEALQLLLQALQKNIHLSLLDISRTQWTEQVANALAKALQTNSNLKILLLKNCTIRGNGASTIVQAIKKNRALTTLDLSQTFLPQEAFNSLFEALKENTTLTQLDLSGRQIHYEELEKVLEAIGHSPSLTHLNLGSNFVNVTDSQIASAIRSRPKISQLICNNSVFSDQAVNFVEKERRIFSISRISENLVKSVYFSAVLRLAAMVFTKPSIGQALLYNAVDMTVSGLMGSLFLQFSEGRNRKLTPEVLQKIQENRRIVSTTEQRWSIAGSRVLGCIAGIGATHLCGIPFGSLELLSLPIINLLSLRLSTEIRQQNLDKQLYIHPNGRPASVKEIQGIVLT